MRAWVTGAGGFVGRALVQRLLQDGRVSALVALDTRLDAARDPWLADARVRRLQGDFADPAVLAAALDTPPAQVFHLASVPGSLAEREPALGWRVNLMGTLALLQRLAETAAPGAPPRVVFASSIAVYGPLGRDAVDEDQPTRPTLDYGSHKRIGELLLADASRRGVLDGCALRLPGLVARAPAPASGAAGAASGHGSAFMSELLHAIAAGRAYTCPVSPQATCWWMSLSCAVDNLLHAAALPAARLPADRVVQLPVLHASVAEVAAAARATAPGAADALRHAPDAAIEAIFGRYPPLLTPQARALGFRDDGTLPQLVQAALAAGAQAG